ncbi:MAG: hypothetical protein H6765_00435 [Candidatus Peribacteria bacterium]|nr:MAG: hypothetical protein H6765_00435 [Candidatus Peribacteria bacterium]
MEPDIKSLEPKHRLSLIKGAILNYPANNNPLNEEPLYSIGDMSFFNYYIYFEYPDQQPFTLIDTLPVDQVCL